MQACIAVELFPLFTIPFQPAAPFIIIERSIHTHGVPRNSWLTVECEKSENDRGGGQRGGDDSGCWSLHGQKKVIGPDGGQ